ncbi:hypothetical protein [Paraflavitalea pollutisoli]|uniref:hypothetical protein n=1 Tax=Paraflavitalea pollutisoli TaxID=3034143 RepID=UPI0023EC1694|nr:hypothetical protein [Paraflavitalea sp. H1-2-19X]
MKKLLTVVAVLFLAGSSAYACKCKPVDYEVTKKKQLKQYDFIALVKIVSVDTLSGDPANPDNRGGRWQVQVTKLIKGKKTTVVFEPMMLTSCQFYMKPGDEWILFGSKEKGKLSIHPCKHDLAYKRADEPQPANADAQKFLDRLTKLYKVRA